MRHALRNFAESDRIVNLLLDSDIQKTVPAQQQSGGVLNAILLSGNDDGYFALVVGGIN